jgi:hypothetical protein
MKTKMHVATMRATTATTGKTILRRFDGCELLGLVLAETNGGGPPAVVGAGEPGLEVSINMVPENGCAAIGALVIAGAVVVGGDGLDSVTDIVTGMLTRLVVTTADAVTMD